jgi:hypothetical protein
MTTGAGGGQGGEGAGGAGAGAGAGAGGAGAGAGSAGGGAGGAAAPWHGITDAEAAQYVANKGWQSPADVIKSYQGAEKLIGRDPNTLLVLPRADDPNGLLSVMDKLGRPADPTKYEFDLPQGADPNNPYLQWARSTFHKLGLPAPMAKALVKEQDAFMAAQAEQMQKDYNTAVENDKAALLKEWGGGHERMLTTAKMAASALGFTGEMVDALEAQLGYAGTMKFFADIGSKMSEDTLHTGDGKQTSFDGAALTPADAKAQWDAMRMDQNTMAALRDKSHPGHKVAQEKQTRLFKVMYGT